MNSICPHGCAGWCAACDFAATYPDGDPRRVVVELPGRSKVTCPRKGCGHPLSAHKDGLCMVGNCACGLPTRAELPFDRASRDRLDDLVRGIAREVEDESPVVALMLRRALKVAGW